MTCQSVEDRFALNLHRFTGRAQLRVTIAATERLSQPFVSQAIASATMWAKQHKSPVVEFRNVVHNKLRHRNGAQDGKSPKPPTERQTPLYST